MTFTRMEQIKLEIRQMGAMYLIVIAMFLLGFVVRGLVDNFGAEVEFGPSIEEVAPRGQPNNYLY